MIKIKTFENISYPQKTQKKKKKYQRCFSYQRNKSGGIDFQVFLHSTLGYL